MKTKEIDYLRIWAKAVDDQEEALRNAPRTWESSDARLARIAFGAYKLQCYCLRLVTKYESPWLELSALEAGRLYLLNKHHWTPEVLREQTLNDLLALLHEELVQMKMSQKEWEPVQNWTSHMSCYAELVKSAPGL
ncbi:hypothetical protein ACTACV_12670 [Pseudomonas syringae]|uniref:hypothetical protein n=1 Tax=Pseudomonas syringae TaxID=317 RepID=UPI003F7505D5